MDELLQTIEDKDSAAKATYCNILTDKGELDSCEKEKNGMEEDSEDEEDEDYEFESSDDDEDNDNEEQQEEDKGNDIIEENKNYQSSAVRKGVGNQHLLRMDDSTHTADPLDYNFDMQAAKEQQIKLWEPYSVHSGHSSR